MEVEVGWVGVGGRGEWGLVVMVLASRVCLKGRQDDLSLLRVLLRYSTPVADSLSVSVSVGLCPSPYLLSRCLPTSLSPLNLSLPPSSRSLRPPSLYFILPPLSFPLSALPPSQEDDMGHFHSLRLIRSPD